MASRFQRWGLIALAANAASFAVWAWIPGTTPDRAAFSTVCRAFTNPPYFVSGQGKPTSPWTLRCFSDSDRVNPELAPVVISLGDDPDNIFQSSPQSPLDLAVVLSNFQRHGVKRPAIPAVLAWEQPDVMGLTSLDAKLAAFESVTMTAPLVRGAVPETMPPSFRRASIPLDRITGDTTMLPVVNRLPVSGVILGGDNCAAGFQSINSEKGGDHPPLLARWDDRVVLAFPLVAAMQQLAVSPDQLVVNLGDWVKLGTKGPTLPIDRFGRLNMPLPNVNPRATITAADLIDAAPGIIPDADKAVVLLRDDHSAADSTTRAFSRSLTSIITAITSDAGLRPPVAYRRPEARTESIFLAALSLLLAWIGNRPRFQQTVGFLSTAGLCVLVQWIGADSATLWLPGIAALSAVLAAAVLSRFLPAARPTLKRAVSSVPETQNRPEAVVDAPPPEKPKAKLRKTAKPKVEEVPAPVVEEPVAAPAKKEPKKRAPAAKKTAKKSPPKSKDPKSKKRRN